VFLVTAPEQDPVRAFTSALTAAARSHLDLTYESIRLIRAATERLSPLELARICSVGIGWNHPANAARLLVFRLRREAQIDDDMEATT
jgi:hypothetical protein